MKLRVAAAITAMAAVLFLGLAAKVTAQSVTTPNCPGTSIRAPFASAVISDTVEILGSARIEGFRFYKVEWAPVSEPESWRAVSQTIEQSVSNGILDRWDTRGIPDGRYRLKLTSVDDRATERCRFVVEDLIVANQATPAPEDDATPLPSPTALEQARATEAPVVTASETDPAIETSTNVETGTDVQDAADAASESEDEAKEDLGPEPEDTAPEDVTLEGGDPEPPPAEDPAEDEGDESTSSEAAAGLLRSILGSFLIAFLATALLGGLVLAYRAKQARETQP